KGTEAARKDLITIPISGTTIPHEVTGNYGAAQVLIKPAAPGTGLIAGGAVRSIVEASGLRDVLTKSLGSSNPINVARAALDALERIRQPEIESQRRGVTLPLRMQPPAPAASVAP